MIPNIINEFVVSEFCRSPTQKIYKKTACRQLKPLFELAVGQAIRKSFAADPDALEYAIALQLM